MKSETIRWNWRAQWPKLESMIKHQGPQAKTLPLIFLP